MKLPPPQRLILYALGQFYQSLNQPLIEKPVKVHTSKITFIELLKRSPQITKQPRAIYKNLETLQQQKFLTYDHHLITLTKTGLVELKKIEIELNQFQSLTEFFKQTQKTKRKLQTVIEN